MTHEAYQFMSRNGSWKDDTATFSLGDANGPNKRQAKLLNNSLGALMTEDKQIKATKLVLGKWKSDKTVDLEYMNKILGRYIEEAESEGYDFKDDLVMKASRSRIQYND